MVGGRFVMIFMISNFGGPLPPFRKGPAVRAGSVPGRGGRSLNKPGFAADRQLRREH
jgi:hypothetical protein